MNILSKNSGGCDRKASEDKTVHEADLIAKGRILRDGGDGVLVESTSAITAFDESDTDRLGAPAFAFFHTVEVFKQRRLDVHLLSEVGGNIFRLAENDGSGHTRGTNATKFHFKRPVSRSEE